MKRIVYTALLVMAAAAVVSAQQWDPGPGSRRGPGPRYDRRHYSGPGQYRADRWENVTVTGNLELIDGNIALPQDEVIYYVTGLNRLIGFVDGLKEGAEVTLEGAALPLPGDGDRRVLQVSKLEIDGKTYDNLTPRFQNR